MTKNILWLFVFISSCSFFRPKYVEPPLPGSLEAAVESRARAEENSDRDEFQHPLETLTFFGIKADLVVAEVSPGAGYYTEILAPYLAQSGQYVIVSPRMPSRPPPVMIQNEQKLQDILLRYHAVQSKARIIPFEPLNRRSATRPGFADVVFSVNSVHNWVAAKSVPMAFKFFHDLLKPQGILGIVQHRIPEGKKNIRQSGYLTEQEVIRMATKHGFKLVSRSEINANPKDTQDYPKGVWTLPPTYRLGDEDRDKYEAIGESDRMTLKFEKK